MVDARLTTAFPFTSRRTWPSLAFIAVAAMGTVAAGVAFLVAAWGDMSNPAAIGALSVVGMWAAAAAVWLSASGRHGRAAAAALASVATPTGFVYLANVAMAVAGGNEIRLAFRSRQMSTGVE